MLKFGFRRKNFYPLMLLLFIFLRLCLDKIFEIHPYKNNIDFVITFLIFFSQSLFGGIIYLYYYPKKHKTEEISQHLNSSSSNFVSTLFFMKSEIKINKIKKIFLMIFASFFNFVGCIIRSTDILNIEEKEENNSYLEVRVRSIQIIISVLLCYFALRLTIYKHQ